MIGLLVSPFFLLFCATSGSAAYLGHRICVLGLAPGLRERALAILSALLSLALSIVTYCMRVGTYCPAYVNPNVASMIAAATGLGVAFVCIKIVLFGEETSSD